MTVTEIEIRPVSVEDAEAVTELTRQLGYEATVEQVRSRITEVQSNSAERAVFVACSAGGVIGWVDVAVVRHLQSEDYGLIGGLVVQDGMRCAGVGKRLCEHAEAWCRGRKLRKVRVTSRSTREDAHRFYLRDGYTDVKMSRVFEKVLD